MSAVLAGVLLASVSCSAVHEAGSPGPGFQASTDTLIGDVVFCGISPCNGETTLPGDGSGTQELILTTSDAIYFKVTFTAQVPGQSNPVAEYTYYCILGAYDGVSGRATLFGVGNPDAWQAQLGKDFNSLFELESGWLLVSADPAGASQTFAPEFLDDSGHRFAGLTGEGTAYSAPMTLGVFEDQPEQVAATRTRFEEINVGWSITTLIRSPRTRGGAPASDYVMWQLGQGLLDGKVYNLDTADTARVNSSQRDIEDPKVVAASAGSPPAWKVYKQLTPSGSQWVPAVFTKAQADLDFLEHVEKIEDDFASASCAACD